MKKCFSETLKQLRIDAGYTQKQVYEMIGVPQSTFSSWEVGKSEPSADVLLKLCKIYGVNDILSAFGYDGYNEDGSICLNMREIDIVEKYRLLDDHGKEMVDFTLLKEWERSTSLIKKSNVTEMPQYLEAKAAHSRTNTLSTPEGQAHDFAIMDDNKEWE